VEVDLTLSTFFVEVEAAVVVLDAEWITVALFAGGERFITPTTRARI